MANPWFRMYSEFATDPKVQMLSESDQRRFLMLLCFRCSNGDETLHDEEIAFLLRIPETDWSATKAVLMGKGLIDEYGRPLAWEKRQYVSDSSTARVRAYRERKKKTGNACNVSVTPPDTDTDTDTDIKEHTHLAQAPARIDNSPPPDQGPASKPDDLPPPLAPSGPYEMPSDWMPDERLLKVYCFQSGVKPQDIRQEQIAQYRLFHHPLHKPQTEEQWVAGLVRWVLKDRARDADALGRIVSIKRKPAGNDALDDDCMAWAH